MLGAATVGVGGGIALAAVEKGRSFRAQAIIALFRATRRRRKFESLENLNSAIEADRKAGPSEPPASLRQRYDVTEEWHGGARVHRVRPKNAASKGTILYIHGGGYVFDIISPHWDIIRSLADDTDAEIVVPLYPLAPEATYREGHAVLDKVWRKLAASEGPVVIAGDSAGGGFALALAQRIRDAGENMPAGLLLFSPWGDVTMQDPLIQRVQSDDPMLHATGARAAGVMWAGGDDLQTPAISPLYGSMTNLPPVAIFIGSSDILLADARRLRERFLEAGVNVEYFEYPNMMHVWVGAPIPEAKRALGEAADFLKRRFL